MTECNIYKTAVWYRVYINKYLSYEYREAQKSTIKGNSSAN
jgi:hypothetical protein